MTKYSVYTEALRLDELKQVAKQHVQDCFSVHHLDGCYKGNEEKSVVFEFIVNGEIDGAVSYFAETCKELNKQEVVLVTKEKIEMEWVY
jgi:hypothetical protein